MDLFLNISILIVWNKEGLRATKNDYYANEIKEVKQNRVNIKFEAFHILFYIQNDRSIDKKLDTFFEDEVLEKLFHRHNQKLSYNSTFKKRSF